MKIRPATVEDAPSVWETHVSAIRILCRDAYTPEQIEAWAGPRKPEDYRKPITDGQLFVAEVAGRVVGFGEFSKEEVRAVYVHPEFGRRGIGTALFRRVVEALGKLGVEKASLDASITSVPFYLAMGCKAGVQQIHRLGSGVEIPCVPMTVEIRNPPNRFPKPTPGAA